MMQNQTFINSYATKLILDELRSKNEIISASKLIEKSVLFLVLELQVLLLQIDLHQEILHQPTKVLLPVMYYASG